MESRRIYRPPISTDVIAAQTAAQRSCKNHHLAASHIHRHSSAAPDICASPPLLQRNTTMTCDTGRQAHEGQAELVQANALLKSEIAERKRAEQALQQSQQELRELAGHQITIKENERTRIAREVHDELGSLLTGIKANIYFGGDIRITDTSHGTRVVLRMPLETPDSE